MGGWIGRAVDTFRSALGVPQCRGDPSLRRDVLLGLPVVAGEVLAGLPVLYLAGGHHVPPRVLCQATIGLVAAVAIGLISPRWNLLLAAGWLFMASRSVVSLILGGGVRAILLGLLFLALAGGCIQLGRVRSAR